MKNLHELFIGDKKYLSLKQASEISGYTKDYIGYLCRENKIEATRIGRDWFVDPIKLVSYKLEVGQNSDQNDPSITDKIVAVVDHNVAASASQLLLKPPATKLSTFDNFKKLFFTKRTILILIAVMLLTGIFAANDIITSRRSLTTESTAPQLSPAEQLALQQGATTTAKTKWDISPSDLVSLKSFLISELSGRGLVTNTIIEKPTIIERAVERIVGGVSKAELDAQLNIVNNKLLAQVADLKNLIATRSDQNFSAIALTNKIDVLNGTSLSNVSFSGSVSGLTDAMIPDNITVNGYLPLAGGTISGNLTVTGTCTGCGGSGAGTLNFGTVGSLAIYTASGTTATGTDINLLSFDNTTGRLGIGTSSPYAKLSVVGQVVAEYFTATSTAATSTFTNLTATQSALGTVIAGTWQGSPISALYGGTGTSTYLAGDILYASTTNPTSLTHLPIGTAGQVLKITGGLPTWGTDLSGSGGSGAWATTTNSLALYPATPSNVVIVGNNATTSTGNILEVTGQSYFNGNVGIGTSSPYAKLAVTGSVVGEYFTATSTTATSTFPYLSATQSNLGTVVGGTWQGTTIANTYGGTGQNSSAWNGLASIVNGTWSASSTIAVSNGGTGWGNLQANSILLGNGNGAIATTSAGTNGQLLVLANGVPTWNSTTTASASQFGFLSANDWTTFNNKLGNYDWQKETNFGQLMLTPTTTIPIWAKDAIYASSTLTVNGPANFNSITATSTLNVTGLTTLGNASTSILTVSSTASTTNLVATNSILGTITSSLWNGTAIATTYGGTGQNFSASSGLINLYSGVASAIATSSLGLLTTNVAEGTNLYWTNDRFDNRLSATTTLPNLTTLLGLQNASTSLLTVSNLASTTNLIVSNNLGIGTSSPYAALSVTGNMVVTGTTTLNSTAYHWPNADGSSNQVLTTNGAGQLSWATASGSGVPDWQKETNFGVLTLTPTTTIPIWAKSALYASSTLTVDGLASFQRATSTQLTVTGQAYFNSTTTFNGVPYLFPNADGTTAGQVLTTNSAGQLSWATAGSGGITPSFSAKRNGPMDLAAGSWTAVVWEATNFDTNNNFSTGTSTSYFQPSVAGKYLLTASVRIKSLTAGKTSMVAIKKNTSYVVIGSAAGASGTYDASHASAVIDANGTTDYFTVQVYQDDVAIKSLEPSSGWTTFTGSRLDGGSNWTDNGATTYLATGDNAAVGTSTAYSKLTVWATSTTPSVFSAIGTASTTLFTIMNTGNVGVGTTTPWGKFSVEMDATEPAFVIANQGSSTPALYVSGVNGNGNVGIGKVPVNTDETLDVLGSFAVENPAGTDNFLVGSNGRVGIGTSSPTNKFVVSTTASTDGIVLDGTTAPAYWLRASSTNRFILGLSTVAGNFIGSSAVNDISFRSEGAKMMFSTDSGSNALMTMTSSGANGKVGIGLTNPSERLEVLGAIKFGATTTAPVYDSASRIWMQSGVGSRYDGFTHQFDVGASRTQALKIDSNGNFYLSSGVSAVATGNYLCINTSTFEVTRGNGSTCTTSSGRFKENILGLSYGLSDVVRLNPVVFNYKPEMKMGTTTHLGFIAEEMLPIIPEVVNIGADGLPSGIDYPVLTSVLTKALQETVSILDIKHAATSSQTLLSYYSATGTPAIYVNAMGNIGIGTTTPNYKLTVDGEAAAKGFINISTKEAKKDIVYLNASDEDSALAKIKVTNLATYNYNGEDCNSNPRFNLGSESQGLTLDGNAKSCRLGLIAEEAPKEVLSIDGKGVDLYKMTSFAWLGLKAQEKKLDNLELRLSALEQQWQYTKGATSTNSLPTTWNTSGDLLAAVVPAFQNLGITLANGLVQAREFIADKVTARKVIAESLEMKDAVTSDVYCLRISNGEWSKVKGMCEESPQAIATSTVSITTTPVEIIMNGNNPATLQINDTYGDLGATASTTDQGIIALGIRTFQNGVEVAVPTIDTSTATTSSIVYRIIDGNANILAEVTRTVIVEAPLTSTAPITATTTTATSATTTNPIASTTPTI